MKITQDILDDLTAKAKESPRLRMNLDLRDSAEDTSQRMLTECKSAYQQYFPRGRVDKEFSCQGILDYCWRRKELSHPARGQVPDIRTIVIRLGSWARAPKRSGKGKLRGINSQTPRRR